MRIGKHRGNRKAKNIPCRAGQDIQTLTEKKGSWGCKDKAVQGIREKVEQTVDKNILKGKREQNSPLNLSENYSFLFAFSHQMLPMLCLSLAVLWPTFAMPVGGYLDGSFQLSTTREKQTRKWHTCIIRNRTSPNKRKKWVLASLERVEESTGKATGKLCSNGVTCTLWFDNTIIKTLIVNCIPSS